MIFLHNFLSGYHHINFQVSCICQSEDIALLCKNDVQ